MRPVDWGLAVASQLHDVLEFGERGVVLDPGRVEELNPHGVREANLRLQQERLVRFPERVVEDENARLASASRHRLCAKACEDDVDHYRGGEEFTARNGHLVDRHVLGLAFALGFQDLDPERRLSQCGSHSVDECGGDVLAGLRDPAGIGEVAHVASNDVLSLRDWDSRQVRVHLEHGLAIEPRDVLWDPSLTEHSTHDVQGGAEQTLEFSDASVPVFIEPGKVVFDGFSVARR